jgi:TolB-like protein
LIGMADPTKAIFLSYASQDVEPARRICDALRAAGLEVWFDQSELRGGDAWDAAIRKQVRDCALFIALVSANTNARSEGYFRREWNLAVHRMLDMADDQPFLLPVLIDDTPEPAARVPDRFRERQWSRMPGGQETAGFVERVARLLAGGPALPAATPVPAQSSAAADGAARGEDGFWVAVLPFKCRGTDGALTALAEGLAEDIVTGLSRFSYLRVISRSSTMRFTDAAFDVRTVGKELGARYVVEGSLRQAGAQLRITVQLVDAATGAHLWAETYERPFHSEDLFALQDDLVPRIVSTVADMHGVLPRSMSDAVRKKAADQLTPYEALLHSFGYNERWTTEALAEARNCLERAVQQDPGNGDCWAMLSLMYSNEFGHWDNRDPATFEKALRAARTAVLLAPLHSLPHYALAQALFFRREFSAARTAAERAVALNPLDAATAAFMGLLIAYSGDWPRGCELAERGLKLNPNLPGMYNYTAWHDAYGRKDYRRALDLALKLDTPDNFYQHAVLAMCYAQLGEMDAAHKSLQQTLSLKPDYGKVARQLHGKWIQPELVEQLMDGLRKAGLEVAPRPL